MSEPIHISDAEFESKVLRSTTPVLVDFWAPWCGPCRMVAPVLEQIARDLGDRLTVVKVNTDENPIWAGRYEVQGIPTLLMIAGGQVLDRIVGALPAPLLQAQVERFLASQAEPVH